MIWTPSLADHAVRESRWMSSSTLDQTSRKVRFFSLRSTQCLQGYQVTEDRPVASRKPWLNDQALLHRRAMKPAATRSRPLPARVLAPPSSGTVEGSSGTVVTEGSSGTTVGTSMTVSVGFWEGV